MGKVGYVSVFWLRWCGCCWVGGLGQGLGGFYGVMSVCVWIICVDGRSRYLYTVLGRFLCSSVHPVFNPVAHYRYLLPNLYLSVADIANPDFFACGSRAWFSLHIPRFYEEHCQPFIGSTWPACL